VVETETNVRRYKHCNPANGCYCRQRKVAIAGIEPGDQGGIAQVKRVTGVEYGTTLRGLGFDCFFMPQCIFVLCQVNGICSDSARIRPSTSRNYKRAPIRVASAFYCISPFIVVDQPRSGLPGAVSTHRQMILQDKFICQCTHTLWHPFAA